MTRPSFHQRRCHTAVSRAACLLLAAALPAALAGPAAADRLVLRDGSVVETEGAWRVEGRLVVFERPGGRLASLRLADVDLDASAAATEEAKAAAEAPPPPEPAPPPKKRAVLVLTDADVRNVRPAETATDAGEAVVTPEAGGQGASDSERPPATLRLEVSRWEQVSDPDVDGVVITGEIPNRTPNLAANIELTVMLYDAEGELVATNQAELTATTLQPGQTARFRAEILGVFSFSAVKFEVERLALGTRREAGDEGAETGES